MVSFCEIISHLRCHRCRIPQFDMVLPLCPDGGYFSLLVLGTIAAILIRHILMKKQIQRVVGTPLWGASLDRDKREALFVVITSAKPSDINKLDEIAARYVDLPTKMAVGVMAGVVNLLYARLGEGDRMKLLGALAVHVVGGIGIGGTRHGSLGMDCFFRCLFAVGFIAVLYYLNEVSEIVLIESISS